MSNSKTISILNLLLIVALAACAFGVYSKNAELQKAKRVALEAKIEVEEMRRKFGYIEIEDPTLFYAAKVEDEETGYNSYRLHLPADNRYMFHISDTNMPTSEIPESMPRTKTLSMNGWREGADVLLQWAIWVEDGESVLDVKTQLEQLFRYKLQNWDNAGVPNEGWQFAPESQVSYKTDEVIHLMYFRNEKTKRAIILWLEPFEKWQAHMDAKKSKRK